MGDDNPHALSCDLRTRVREGWMVSYSQRPAQIHWWVPILVDQRSAENALLDQLAQCPLESIETVVP